MVTRRKMLKLSLLAGASLMVPAVHSINDAEAQMGGGMMGGTASPAVTPFRRPLPIPDTLAPYLSDATTDYYAMTMQAAQVEILPGLRTTIWGYYGKYPGATIRARSGRKVVIRQTNGLPENMVVHLHGGHTPADSDGHPMDQITPGTYKDYFYPNNQQAATLWYHDHTMDLTAPHVYKGLAGFYILEDDYERSLPLPKGEFDVPILIQDRRFNADGSLYYAPGSGGMMMDSSFLGDTILVNGAVQPFFQVAKRKYRFRILNGSNARQYQLRLSNGATFTHIGSDGGLLPQPVARTAITIYPGERVELIIDFSAYAIGTQIVLKNAASSGRTGDIMRFDVTRAVVDDSAIPSILRPYELIPSAAAVTTRTFTLSRNMSGVWVINGLPFDRNRIDAYPRRGTTEIWRFVNQSNMVHPMHIHLVMFQVLDVNGVAVTPSSPYYGWKDTVQAPANGQVRVIAKFADYTGDYITHCHILEHEDRAMMSQFKVVT